jgi:hypothetical protein
VASIALGSFALVFSELSPVGLLADSRVRPRSLLTVVTLPVSRERLVAAGAIFLTNSLRLRFAAVLGPLPGGSCYA